MELIIITGFTALILVNLILLALFLNTRSDLSRRVDDVDRHMNQMLQSGQLHDEQRMENLRRTLDERLEELHKGLGEMQSLAGSVGDLSKILSNVKTRGILGEIQLGAILEQILAPEQYATNIAVVPGSSERVEYAISMPGEGSGRVYLPIDSKFPADYYARLSDAYESGNQADIEAAYKALENRIKAEAKSIHDKYICPPYTTDFAVMFLPIEGLYAEVVRRNLIEILQRDYKVSIAGPTTMAALLNSLQMGFRTLAIQKNSSEVWTVLAAVKTEFDKFGAGLEKAQERIDQAQRELDALVVTRTNMIRQKLRDVQNLK
ncbi:MAG: DNA recombination protein RmuC [Firmicutes bacterium]|nr:DNA recombination protein RmuC [Bacillota bacterium]MBR6014947.1 DNA recombination protein RmuC [Bacillota bacterium]